MPDRSNTRNSLPPRPTGEPPRVAWLGWLFAVALLNVGLWEHSRFFVIVGAAFLGGMCMSKIRKVWRQRLLRQTAVDRP